MSEDIRLTMVKEQEIEIAKALDRVIAQAKRDADALDPRTQDEMFRKLPTEHPANRLRHLAYRMQLAREALL